jgi:hypothetical protein
VAVTRLEIRARRAFEDGAAFGTAGSYERIDGIAHFAVDPANPANVAIVDLDRAARRDDGLVHFAADFCLLQPADPARGNGKLLFDVVNRGRKPALERLLRARPAAAPSDRIDPGDGFLLRDGWTLAWCGWQWDVVRSAALLGFEAPRALDQGRPVEGSIEVQFQPNEPVRDQLLANRVHQPYPVADVDQADALLQVADWPDGPRQVIPRSRWRFARDVDGRPVADENRVWLDTGFEPGRIYDVIYRTRECPVVGTGLLAVRDFNAFLRRAETVSGNPSAGRIEHALGFGVSQSGRVLRQYLSSGLNLDESGQQVFDGLLIHVAGERRGEFNQRYGQPSVQFTPGFGHQGPFHDDPQTDPITGHSAGFLDPQRAVGGVPKLVYTNSGAEYWRGGASLIHTDLAGERDAEPSADTRIYSFASAQHTPGVVPQVNYNPTEGARGAHGFNTVDYSPLLRAALVNLDRWVTAGQEPPPSAFPRLADGTAKPACEVVGAYRGIPGMNLPDPERLPLLRRFDLGPEAGRGIGRWPAIPGERYPAFVSAVDADGNELAGLRLPDLTVPLATNAPWNPRHPETGAPELIIAMQGSTIPFPATAAERARTGDPRRSIEERYRDRDDYLVQVRAAAEALVAQRLVLPEDIDYIVATSAARWETFVGTPAGAAAR